MTLSTPKPLVKSNQKTYRNNFLFGGNREEAIIRDGEKCVRCGMTREQHKKTFGRDITVDHKNHKGRHTPKEEQDNRLENLQTLCLPCHGVKDNTLEKYKGFIAQYTKDGKLVAIYPSMSEAARKIGGNVKSISVTAGHKPHYKTAYGFIWERIQEDL